MLEATYLRSLVKSFIRQKMMEIMKLVCLIQKVTVKSLILCEKYLPEKCCYMTYLDVWDGMGTLLAQGNHGVSDLLLLEILLY